MNRGDGCLLRGVSEASGDGGALGHLDERVERVRVTTTPDDPRAGGLEHLVDDRFVREPEPGAVFGRAPRHEVPGAFGIGELPRVPLPPDPRVRRIPIHRLGLQTLLAHHRNRLQRPSPTTGPRPAGATVAADAIASAFGPDNFPARIASAVAGNASICFDVSNMLRAADTDVPDAAAICSAAER